MVVAKQALNHVLKNLINIKCLFKRTFYDKWKHSFILRQKLTKLDTIAIKHYEYMHMTRVYATWKHRYQNELYERRKLRMAVSHHRNYLLSKCFHAIIIYTKYRHKKNIQKGLFLRCKFSFYELKYFFFKIKQNLMSTMSHSLSIGCIKNGKLSTIEKRLKKRKNCKLSRFKREF